MAGSDPQDSSQRGTLASESVPPKLADTINARKAKAKAGLGEEGAAREDRENWKRVPEQSYRLAAQVEETRAKLAKRLLILLFVSLGGIIVYIGIDILYGKGDADLHRELMTIIWTSEVTLVSGALGYYFGSERNGSSNQ